MNQTAFNVEQIYTGCLAQGAYYITSGKDAVIIDPLREIQPYIQRLERDGVILKYIFETHFHADFVSGHLDLSKATGAPIVYGPNAAPEFECIVASDGQVFEYKIMTLADDVIVYPAHGAGSACGKNMSKETVSTIGQQKAENYALRANMTEQEFIREVTDGLLPPPAYFGMNVAMNKKGYASFNEVLNQGMRALTPEAFEAAAEETGALILDTRAAAEFHRGFVPQSVNIGLKGDFAPWVGAMIGDVNQPILLVTDAGSEEEAVTRLSRVGFDNVLGHLAGGFAAWMQAGKEVDTVHRITADEFAAKFDKANSVVVDVRKESEYAAEHVEDAYSKPLAYINQWVRDLDPKQHFFLHCAGGYRSMIAASILQARGYRNFSEVEGGFGAISKTEVPKTDFVCQSKVMKA